MEIRNQFVFNKSFYDVVERYRNKGYTDVALELYSAIAKYALTGETPEFNSFEAETIWLTLETLVNKANKKNNNHNRMTTFKLSEKMTINEAENTIKGYKEKLIKAIDDDNRHIIGGKDFVDLMEKKNHYSKNFKTTYSNWVFNDGR